MDERPIVTREYIQGHAGTSPDERFVEGPGRYGSGSGFGGDDETQGSPPKAKPRILYSGEGSRPHNSREEEK